MILKEYRIKAIPMLLKTKSTSCSEENSKVYVGAALMDLAKAYDKFDMKRLWEVLMIWNAWKTVVYCLDLSNRRNHGPNINLGTNRAW